VEPPLSRLAEQSAKRAIPNREVKHFSGDDSDWATFRENNSRPGDSSAKLTELDIHSSKVKSRLLYAGKI